MKHIVPPFTDWIRERDPNLNEVGTSTANVAMFMRPTMPIVRRNGEKLPLLTFGNDEDEKEQCFSDKKRKDKKKR